MKKELQLTWTPAEWKKMKKKEALDKNISFVELLRREWKKEQDEISKNWKYKI